MVIEYVVGDIFESNCQALINTVNCEGKMGKGLAYQFKKKFPEMEKEYIKKCENGELQPGKLHIYQDKEYLIINFPTKNKWREKSKLKYIQDGLRVLAQEIRNRNIPSIAIPPLGAGNGGLNWDDVKKEITTHLYGLGNVKIYVYEPSQKIEQNQNVPKIMNEMLILAFIAKNLKNKKKSQLKSVIDILKILSKNTINLGNIESQYENLKKYKSYYNIGKYDDLYLSLYNKLISKSVETDINNKFKNIENVINLVNKYSDFSSKIVVILLEIERNSGKYNILNKEVEEILVKEGLVEVDIFQNYNINYF